MDAKDRLAFDQVIDWIKSGKHRLTAYSPTTLKILGKSNFDADVAVLERMILDDQVLATEVLRVANSPFYCAASPITTVRNAIVRLGRQMVKRIVSLVSERPRYKSWYPDLNNMLIQLWTHVSMTALSAQWLSQRLHLNAIQEVCFLGGLLHDIGRLIIICAIDEMRKTRNIEKTVPIEILDEFITDNHCRVGYEIMKRWEIPDVYCLISRDHHEPEFSADDLPLTIVRLANSCSSQTENIPASQLSETPEARALNIDEDALLELQKTLGMHKAMTA